MKEATKGEFVISRNPLQGGLNPVAWRKFSNLINCSLRTDLPADHTANTLLINFYPLFERKGGAPYFLNAFHTEIAFL